MKELSIIFLKLLFRRLDRLVFTKTISQSNIINTIIHSIVINQILIVLSIKQSLDLYIDLKYRFIILLIKILKFINFNNLFNIKTDHRN